MTIKDRCDTLFRLFSEASELLVGSPIVRQNIDFARRACPWLAIDAEHVDLRVWPKYAPNFPCRRTAYAMAARANFENTHSYRLPGGVRG